jgi:hypothetical protein
MHLLIAKALAAGFAASIAVSGSTTLRTQFPAPQPGGTVSSALYAEPAIENKAPSPLDLWIDKLVYLESEGKEHLKVLDQNGYYSYGCLQFQMATFEAYAGKYGFFTTDDNAETLIYDCGLQKAIAKRMIEDDANNWRHWFTSVKVRNLGFPPKETLASKT